jgi:hypothetical protein
MPYVREGAQKVSDHWVRSPLLEGNINRACQVCHNVPEPELRARAETIQNRTHKLIGNASRALVDMLDAIKAAKASGATESQLAEALKLQRSAQWRLDFVASENSMGFHADQETARVLGESIDLSRRAQIAAYRSAHPPPPRRPNKPSPSSASRPPANPRRDRTRIPRRSWRNEGGGELAADHRGSETGVTATADASPTFGAFPARSARDSVAVTRA